MIQHFGTLSYKHFNANTLAIFAYHACSIEFTMGYKVVSENKSEIGSELVVKK